MLKIPELKIGTRIDVVFENEINTSGAHYMKALVYDYENSNIIISQTSPALTRHFLNRRMLVTFLGNVETRTLRFGLSARFIDLIANYQISANNNVEALVLKPYGKPDLLDFRMHFRVKPPSQSNISLFFKEEKINLIDISIGGAKFSYPKSNLFLYGNIVKFKLIIDSTEFNIEARVCNASPPQDRTNLQFIGIDFEHDNRQLDTALGRAILAIERQMLSEGKVN
ncbi:MAG: hypothetical protein CVU71_07770 [Deltaproteobacteria bacterium HGW-Deltaproteobacteria-6]|jgi:hypothetical protein|nr:MAG: hypothetical protein CVU71_07770 [Deltaproteobacteria bacterium HGW-Deltaproteobacteria-6]